MSRLNRLSYLVLLGYASLRAQTPEIRSILERLDRLERENRALTKEVRELRGQLAAVRGTPSAAPPATLADIGE